MCKTCDVSCELHCLTHTLRWWKVGKRSRFASKFELLRSKTVTEKDWREIFNQRNGWEWMGIVLERSDCWYVLFRLEREFKIIDQMHIDIVYRAGGSVTRTTFEPYDRKINGLGEGCYGRILSHPTDTSKVLKIFNSNYKFRLTCTTLREMCINQYLQDCDTSSSSFESRHHIIKFDEFIDCYQGPVRKNPAVQMNGYDLSLSNLLNEKRLSETEVLSFATQLFKGVHFMHKNGISHRDLKCGNIMLKRTGELVIVDFGLSKLHSSYHCHHDSSNLFQVSSNIVTLPYRCPELLELQLKEAFASQNVNVNVKLLDPVSTHTVDPFAVDVWGVGAILLNMLGSTYFYSFAQDEMSALTAIAQLCGRKTQFSPCEPVSYLQMHLDQLGVTNVGIRRWVEQTLEFDPTLRITMKKLMEDEDKIPNPQIIYLEKMGGFDTVKTVNVGIVRPSLLAFLLSYSHTLGLKYQTILVTLTIIDLYSVCTSTNLLSFRLLIASALYIGTSLIETSVLDENVLIRLANLCLRKKGDDGDFEMVSCEEQHCLTRTSLNDGIFHVLRTLKYKCLFPWIGSEISKQDFISKMKTESRLEMPSNISECIGMQEKFVCQYTHQHVKMFNHAIEMFNNEQ
jgi:serine/threonine protein kinase